jgi:hypothetical protein
MCLADFGDLCTFALPFLLSMYLHTKRGKVLFTWIFEAPDRWADAWTLREMRRRGTVVLFDDSFDRIFNDRVIHTKERWENEQTM